jgi:hypothetical protein
MFEDEDENTPDGAVEEPVEEVEGEEPAVEGEPAPAPGFVEGLAQDQDFLTLVNQARETGTKPFDIKNLSPEQKLVAAQFFMGLQGDVERGQQAAAAQRATQDKVVGDAAAARQQALDEAAEVDAHLSDPTLDAFIASLRQTPDPEEIDVLDPASVTALIDARAKRMAAEVLAGFRAEQLKLRQVRVTAATNVRTEAARAAREAQIESMMAAEPLFEDVEFESLVEQEWKGLTGDRRFERATEIAKLRWLAEGRIERPAGKEPARRAVKPARGSGDAPNREFKNRAEEDAFLVGNPDALAARLAEAKRRAGRA